MAAKVQGKVIPHFLESRESLWVLWGEFGIDEGVHGVEDIEQFKIMGLMEMHGAESEHEVDSGRAQRFRYVAVCSYSLLCEVSADLLQLFVFRS